MALVNAKSDLCVNVALKTEYKHRRLKWSLHCGDNCSKGLFTRTISEADFELS